MTAGKCSRKLNPTGAAMAAGDLSAGFLAAFHAVKYDCYALPDGWAKVRKKMSQVWKNQGRI
jgi:hypothetical protein